MSKSKTPRYTWDNPQPSYTERKGCYTVHAARSIKRGDMLRIKHPWRPDTIGLVLMNSVRACGELKVLAERVWGPKNRPELDVELIYPDQILERLGNAFTPYQEPVRFEVIENPSAQAAGVRFINSVKSAEASPPTEQGDSETTPFVVGARDAGNLAAFFQLTTTKKQPTIRQVRDQMRVPLSAGDEVLSVVNQMALQGLINERGVMGAACEAIRQACVLEGEPLARILRWAGPSNYPVPHGGICARTYEEFPYDAGQERYWKETDTLLYAVLKGSR